MAGTHEPNVVDLVEVATVWALVKLERIATDYCLEHSIHSFI